MMNDSAYEKEKHSDMADLKKLNDALLAARDKVQFNKDFIMKELCDIKAEYPCGTELTTHLVNFKKT